MSNFTNNYMQIIINAILIWKDYGVSLLNTVLASGYMLSFYLLAYDGLSSFHVVICHSASLALSYIHCGKSQISCFGYRRQSPMPMKKAIYRQLWLNYVKIHPICS